MDHCWVPATEYEVMGVEGEEHEVISHDEIDEELPELPAADFGISMPDGYDWTDVAGEGGNSMVMRAVRRKDGKEVAIKVLEKENALETDVRPLFEAELLRVIDSDRVVRFIEVAEDADYLYIVMEYLSGGDLVDYMLERKRVFSEVEALKIVEGVLEGLMHMHHRGIAHRDIKLENIVLEGGDPARAKLIDLGLAYRRQNGMSELATDFCGTPEFCAPEVVRRIPYVPEQVDMWGVGVVLYALTARRMPFASNRAIVQEKVHVDNTVTRDVRDLIRQLLSKDPSARPSAEQSLEMVKAMLHKAEGPADSFSWEHIVKAFVGTHWHLAVPVVY